MKNKIRTLCISFITLMMSITIMPVIDVQAKELIENSSTNVSSGLKIESNEASDFRKMVTTGKKTPTRTTMLDVSELTVTTDMLATEGWKWVPAASGGTLTLRNCYIQSQNALSLQLPDGDVTISLEGENTIETMGTEWNPMIYSVNNVSSQLNTTIVAGTEDGKLNILRKDTSSTSKPFVFEGNTLNIKSGEIYANMGFCVIKSSFTMHGGSLKIDVANNQNAIGIFTEQGDVNISGGTLDINAGQIGIWIPGIANKGGEKVSLTGGNVKIRSGLAGIFAKNITVNTNGNLDLQGKRTALFCSKNGGTLEILAAGSLMLSGEKPYFPESTGGEKTVIIGDANYTAVKKAADEAKALNPDDYMTGLTNVYKALDDVILNKNVLEQNTVNGYATAIENAIKALVYKDADYTKVDEAIKNIPSDLNVYTAESVQTLKEAVEAVVAGKNITEQKIVDGYAEAIENAIKALKLIMTPITNTPTIIEGTNQSVSEGETAVFKSNAKFSDFLKVLLDGKELSSDNYTVAEGSTIVTLKADFLKTLSAGSHSLSIVSTTGTASTNFVMKEATPATPETSDNTFKLLYMIFAASSVAVIIFINKKRKGMNIFK